MVGNEIIIDDTYTVELYDSSGKWLKQAYVTDTYEDADEWIENHPYEDGGYYSIFCIQYDNETGEEMCCFPVY